MGIYKLSDGYELKGWRNIPYALIDHNKLSVKELTPSACLFLLSCDGISEVQDTPEAQRFVERGVIEKLAAPIEQPESSPIYERIDQLYRPKVQLAITGRCNMHCRHCLASDGDENVSTQLTLQDCNRIFDEMIANNIYRLWITGGEPLIHPDFREIFSSAVEHGLHITSIYTNAWLVDSSLLDFIESQGQRPEFVVSFDGIGTHDWMRCREGAQEHTMERIALLREHGFRVRIGINVNSVTAPGIIDTCRTLAADYGVSSLHPIYTSPTPRWVSALENGIDALAPEDYYDLMIELMRIARIEKWNAKIDVIHMPRMHGAPRNPKTWELFRNPPEAKDDLPTFVCGRAQNVIFICSDGRVLPCSTYEGMSMMMGWFQGDDINVLKTPLAQILASSEYSRTFEPTIADIEQQEPGCIGCKWLAICRGGCALYTQARKYYDAGNPICIMYRDGYAMKYLDMLEETEAEAWEDASAASQDRETHANER